MTNSVRVKYQTIEIGQRDIHLCTLRDKQQFSDPEGLAETLGINSSVWPLFGVIWPSSMVLAHYINDFPTKGKRILELGCGMALTSLLLNQKHANISATDYHPEVERYLNRNTQLNGDADIYYEQTNWRSNSDTLGKFGLIIGSDILYEDQHIAQLATFIEVHSPIDSEVVLVDPGRGRKNKLTKIMVRNGYALEQILPINTDYLAQPFKGHILKYTRLSLEKFH